MTKIFMSTLDVNYDNLLVFVNTICLLSIYQMSLSSFHNINAMTNSSIIVSADSKPIIHNENGKTDIK